MSNKVLVEVLKGACGYTLSVNIDELRNVIPERTCTMEVHERGMYSYVMCSECGHTEFTPTPYCENCGSKVEEE